MKRQFSALIPAFDPRPGRTNVNQISEVEVTPPNNESPSTSQERNAEPEGAIPPQPKLKLSLKGPNLPGVSRSENVRLFSFILGESSY